MWGLIWFIFQQSQQSTTAHCLGVVYILHHCALYKAHLHHPLTFGKPIYNPRLSSVFICMCTPAHLYPLCQFPYSKTLLHWEKLKHMQVFSRLPLLPFSSELDTSWHVAKSSGHLAALLSGATPLCRWGLLSAKGALLWLRQVPYTKAKGTRQDGIVSAVRRLMSSSHQLETAAQDRC